MLYDYIQIGANDVVYEVNHKSLLNAFEFVSRSQQLYKASCLCRLKNDVITYRNNLVVGRLGATPLSSP